MIFFANWKGYPRKFNIWFHVKSEYDRKSWNFHTLEKIYFQFWKIFREINFISMMYFFKIFLFLQGFFSTECQWKMTCLTFLLQFMTLMHKKVGLTTTSDAVTQCGNFKHLLSRVFLKNFVKWTNYPNSMQIILFTVLWHLFSRIFFDLSKIHVFPHSSKMHFFS